MRLVVFGNPENWKDVIDNVSKYYSDALVAYLSYYDNSISEYMGQDVVITYIQAAEAIRSGKADGVIMADNQPDFDIIEYFEKQGISNIYYYYGYLTKKSHLSSEEAASILTHYKHGNPCLDSLEFHVADQCNLNCKGCTHFSNLLDRDVPFPSHEVFSKDINRLAQLFRYIGKIRVLGGEPLLNPDIDEFLRSARQAFPDTNIEIVSNGLLACNISDKVIQAMKNYKISILVSGYPVLDTAKVRQALENYGVEFNIIVNAGESSIVDFYKNVNTKGDSDPVGTFERCKMKECTFLKDGHIAACCRPILVHLFNNRFNEHCSESGAVDIYDEDITGRAIIDRISHPMEACRYCTDSQFYMWDMSTVNTITEDDWRVK